MKPLFTSKLRVRTIETGEADYYGNTTMVLCSWLTLYILCQECGTRWRLTNCAETRFVEQNNSFRKDCTLHKHDSFHQNTIKTGTKHTRQDIHKIKRQKIVVCICGKYERRCLCWPEQRLQLWVLHGGATSRCSRRIGWSLVTGRLGRDWARCGASIRSWSPQPTSPPAGRV